MTNQLEATLLESTIVDINFSHWQEFIDLVVLSTWDFYDNDVFPVFDLKKIYFRNTSKFSFNLPGSHSGNANACRGINVNNAIIKKSGDSLHISIHIETCSTIEIACSHYEIEKVEQDIQDHFMNNFKKHGKIEFLSAR